VGEIQNQPFSSPSTPLTRLISRVPASLPTAAWSWYGNSTSDSGNDAERLSQDPTLRLIGAEKVWDRGAALTSRLQSSKTERLGEEENFAGLGRLNRAWIRKAETMDSAEIPVYGEQEQSAYNGHFESTCYHPLLLFNREDDCRAGNVRPGNVHNAEGWEELLLPEIERQVQNGNEGRGSLSGEATSRPSDPRRQRMNHKVLE